MKVPYKLLSILMIIAAVIATAIAYPDLPDRVPVRWNDAGQVNGSGPRAMVWLLGPGLMACMLGLAYILPKISPRRFEIEPFSRTFDYSFTVIIAFFGVIHAAMLGAALGSAVRIDRVILASLFVLLILLGNPMGKVRPNFFLGVRTPWTLASPRVWHATHRLAGRMMVASGVAGLGALLAHAPHWLVMPLAGAWALVALVYSFIIYRKLDRTGQLN